ncbi:MAG: hypothetical protein EBZ62_01975 [Sphingobacteriia bacterium]|nr:hypothetical protein [Sphingobacteriia bacterium]
MPWARQAGWYGVNSANVRGLEAERLNVAGLALGGKTELYFSRTNWLVGSDIYMNAFGIAQRVDESSVLALSVMSASGVAFDAGIQYITGPDDRIKFGISLRNVGTPISFSGDGLAARGVMQGSTVPDPFAAFSDPGDAILDEHRGFLRFLFGRE